MLKTEWYRRKRARGQRGAALVEGALVFPLLMFLIFGIIELGSLLSTYSAAANAVRAGGRMASVEGSDADADMQVMARVAQEASAIDDGEIQYIIVWEADGPNLSSGSPNRIALDACIAVAESLGTPNTQSRGVSGSCNIYAHPQGANGAFDMATGAATNPDPLFYFGCTNPATQSTSKVDCMWRPGIRETSISARGVTPRVEPDYVGVYIKVNYHYLTGLLGSTRTITDNSITMLEPDNFGVS